MGVSRGRLASCGRDAQYGKPDDADEGIADCEQSVSGLGVPDEQQRRTLRCGDGLAYEGNEPARLKRRVSQSA